MILFGTEAWVLLTEMEKRLAGVHTVFLRKVKGKEVNRLSDRTWQQEGE